MESINEILSSDLQVQPLKEGEVKIFRLAIFGKVDPATGQPIRKPGYTMAGYDTIKDKTGSRTIMNIISHNPVKLASGETKMDPVAGYVYFDHTATIICTSDDQNKYFFLKRSNKNADNPFRDGRKTAVFYEVNETRDVNIEKMTFEYKIMAGGFVITAIEEDLLRMVSGLVDAGKKEFLPFLTMKGDSLRKSLQPLSQVFPADMLLHSGDPVAVSRVIVDTAVNNQWIVFNDHEEVRRWEWIRTPGKGGVKNILKVELADDPVKALGAFLRDKTGSSHFAELKSRYQTHYNLTL